VLGLADSEVLRDISLNGTLATITEAQPRRRMAGGGKLAMNIDYVKRVSGERRSLEQIKRERLALPSRN
jgi:hypothetical protein